MEFVTNPQTPTGPPAMDVGEPRDTLTHSQDLAPAGQCDQVPAGPSSLSQMELDKPNIQDLVQQFEALPGDLVDLCPDGHPCPLHIATGHGLAPQDSSTAHGLLSTEAGRDDLLNLLHLEECPSSQSSESAPHLLQPPEDADADTGPPEWEEGACAEQDGSRSSSSSPEPWLETVPLVAPEERPAGAKSPETPASYPALQEVPGPCDHEDLLDGVIFGAKYLGSTQLVSERNPPPSTRMTQAQEAMDRVKAPDGESQPMTEVDLFISTKRVKVLTADSQEAMMDHALQTVSYIADIGSVLVLMARRRLARPPPPQAAGRRLYKMICHVFHSEDAQLIARAIGQAFAVAYHQFLRENGLDPSQVGSGQSQGAAGPGHLHNGDLDHFSNSENCREVCIEKRRGEGLGVALVESGWGSLLPTAVIANLQHGGPAERSGALSIGDRLTAINGTSLVGLSLAACQAAVREVKSQTLVTLSIVHCPPVTTAIIRRPHVREQLGFCVEDGIICSLLRGGIAERGGVRVGHRIIEINGHSVVATPHARIIELLTEAHLEVHIKTMPAATYRLLTGQEQPVYL
ncbi:PREDICTED: amyloid beta A4 precursor protein-binding family A member 3 [Condylura cristata]|uniref:amyloid beta A4 precursor protein-binding family A member 3 n=1 Tax=Condylura cristata TaxID=143302 RepID=UPI0003345DCF|nr:PREDICTED: amyloid beta A4 precursor protein-binding family A member 3 [Condylura cristata]XP_012585331.1 PREDICTED: amyloid beta A4 precursor protein-binding family A member 3 [Condylura cristata]XP_012585333.1 PREDICTED: amyloid beta A4 precursor protein-binding family A member 3 [Condylura cristata]XP_012585334.1 PREDICTED: amyloid beta A4 precursor protein-binding family A member 3 [Condylura cristata]